MPDTNKCIAKLKERFGDRLSTAHSVLDQHGHDESWHTCAPPDAELLAETTDDVVCCATICSHHLDPIIPFGTGSSMAVNDMGKVQHFNVEHGNSVPILREIIASMDPNRLLNPGKLFT